MNILQTLSDSISLSLCSVNDLGDDELLYCNKVRVVLAFIAWFFALCSAFNIMFGSLFLLFVILALGLSVNSALAFMEVRERAKEGSLDSNDQDDLE